MFPLSYFRLFSPFPPIWTSEFRPQASDPPSGFHPPSFFSPSLYNIQDHYITIHIARIHLCEPGVRFWRLGGGWELGDELAGLPGEYRSCFRFLTIYLPYYTFCSVSGTLLSDSHSLLAQGLRSGGIR